MLVRSVIYRKNGWGFNFIRPFQKNPNTLWCSDFSFAGMWDSNDLNAICRWHIAVTSANTGHYLYFSFRRKEKCKRIPHPLPPKKEQGTAESNMFIFLSAGKKKANESLIRCTFSHAIDI